MLSIQTFGLFLSGVIIQSSDLGRLLLVSLQSGQPSHLCRGPRSRPLAKHARFKKKRVDTLRLPPADGSGGSRNMFSRNLFLRQSGCRKASNPECQRTVTSYCTLSDKDATSPGGQHFHAVLFQVASYRNPLDSDTRLCRSQLGRCVHRRSLLFRRISLRVT